MERKSNRNVNLFFIHVNLKATYEKVKNLKNNVKTIFNEDQLEMLKSKSGKVGHWSDKTLKTVLQWRCAAGVQG